MFEGYIKGKKIKRKLSSEDLYSASDDNSNQFSREIYFKKENTTMRPKDWKSLKNNHNKKALNKKLRDSGWFNDNKINEPNILNFLDLVSLGTVCDVVPLVGLNRAIVKQGLKVLKKRSNLGLKTLYDLCKIESQPSTYDLGFKLGPRINAGGRVGKSSHGVELLLSNDPSSAYQIALDLEKFNKERQTIEFILIQKIENEVKKLDNQPVLLLDGENWHEGVIGIVASRIKDKYNKPTTYK